MKSVQIPYDLFIDLAMYHLRGDDDFEEEPSSEDLEELEEDLEGDEL